MEYKIFENKEENRRNFIKKGWGHSDLELSKSDLNDILNGKALAMFDGEYTTWIIVKEDTENAKRS